MTQPIQQIDAKRASELMQEGHTYLDVRTIEEFKEGHAQGAVNVPFLFRDASGQSIPNPDFLKVVEANYSRDSGLVVGCHAGGRSQRACEFLAQAGYTRLHNIQGGYGGAKDPLGRVVRPGWSQLGLPVSQSHTAGENYESLRDRAFKEA
jgi:rhodanese-related sulfurtransferase